jgi:hypothetical protein
MARSTQAATISPRPDWLHALPVDPPPFEVAFERLREHCAYSVAPSTVCPMCMTKEMEVLIVNAARQAQVGVRPKPEHYARIYNEHPDCVGGESTHRLFLPFMIRDFVVEPFPKGWSHFDAPDVLEPLLLAGFWYWSEATIAHVRILATRLFLDWFEEDNWLFRREQEYRGSGCLGQGHDILRLCAIALIDPAELVARLAALKTAKADAALVEHFPFTPEPPFYCSLQHGEDLQAYRDACQRIAFVLEWRLEEAYRHIINADWLTAAFMRQTESEPMLAKLISDFEYERSVAMVHAGLSEEATDWPDLPRTQLS